MKTTVAGTAPVSSKAGRKPKSPAAKIVEVLGPVEDLESYVKADWWRHIFNANYLRADGDASDDAAITDREVDWIQRTLNLDPQARILDLCCGQGRHSLALARRGFVHVTGMDRSHYLITKARSAAKREGLALTWKEGDARKLSFDTDQFDCVLILGNSFGYFESEKDDVTVLREVRRVLKPTGRLLMDNTDGDDMRKHFEPRGWEWIDRNYFVCRERSLSAGGDRLVSREVITHVRKGVLSDQFYAERLYNPEQMDALLRDCGFRDIVENRELENRDLESRSRRDQDLGMISRRVAYLARPKKEWSAPAKRSVALRNVAVIMGDPRKADAVKPDATFDEDDYATIDRLKNALGEIEGHCFSWFDNHDTLLADMRRIKGEANYVLNLCDEGYQNAAVKELHVPALLEMFDMPYTGGGPQCLANCYDKSLVRGIARELDIPVPRAFVIRPDDTSIFELTLPFPLIVKPNFGDCSLGITQRSVCHNVSDLEEAVQQAREAFGYMNPILIEEFLGGKDVSVGIIGNSPGTFTVLPVIEEDYSMLPEGLPRICGYEAKWDPDSPYRNLRSIGADLPEASEGFLVASCLRLFERLQCRDYARFDWRLDANETPRLLEVNPNPGWCWDGHLAKMAALAGHDYAQMLRMILQAAEARLGLK